VVILAIQNTHFSILSNNFLTQTSTDYLSHLILSLNIIFQCIFLLLREKEREKGEIEGDRGDKNNKKRQMCYSELSYMKVYCSQMDIDTSF
jgi:hypothetical protein